MNVVKKFKNGVENRMKKILSIFAIMALLFSLVACTSDKTDNKSKEKDAKKDDKKEEVTISFASWGLGTEEEQNLDRLMIKAFEEKYPHIKVQIDESINPADWNGSLAAAASGGTMPDVFMLSQLPLPISNDWLLDISGLASKDKDFANIPEAVQNSAKFDGKLYAVPFAQHFLGFLVNKDLFNAANLDAPEYGVSVEDFIKSIKDVTNVKAGVAGINHPFTFPDWYPAAANKDLGWFTYKDGEFALDSKEFISGINTAKDIWTNGYAYETLTDDQKANFKGENPEEVWLNGGVALKWDGTWTTAHLSEQAGFDWDFIGIPGGRTAVTNDFVGISKSTKHPEEAFLFSKWMSFGKEGYLKRVEIADKEGKTLNSLPVNSDKEVLDAYFEVLDIPGVRTAYENLGNAIVEPVKTAPGYIPARWEAPTGIKVGDNANATTAQLIDSFMKGELKVEDYAKQLDQLADQQAKEATAALNK